MGLVRRLAVAGRFTMLSAGCSESVDPIDSFSIMKNGYFTAVVHASPAL